MSMYTWANLPFSSNHGPSLGTSQAEQGGKRRHPLAYIALRSTPVYHTLPLGPLSL